MEVLLAHGARIDPPAAAGSALLVSACLANGRGEAAEFLARRGAPLDLEAAAGVGRLDIVESFFDRDGRLKPSTLPVERTEALKRACAYGRTNVVEFLLDRGEEVDRRFTGGLWAGTTALHLAAFGGHVQTVQALLKRRAPVDVKDDTYGTTPLTWALYAWANEPDTAPPSCYHEIVRLLVMAGSRVNPEWLEADWARADPRMLAALSGKQD